MAAEQQLVRRLAVKLLTPIVAAGTAKVATLAAERLRDGRPARDLVGDLTGRVSGGPERKPVSGADLEQRRQERAGHRAARRKST